MPTVLFLFSEEWLPRRRDEWEPLSLAAWQAGFDAVVTHWNAVSTSHGVVTVREGWRRSGGSAEAGYLTPVAHLQMTPGLVMTTWGVERRYRQLYESILEVTSACHQFVTIFSRFTRKASFELCLRDYERRTGALVSRPTTLISDELGDRRNLQQIAGDHVIVKPSRGRQCQGIKIVPRSELKQMATVSPSGPRAPFVVQELVSEQFLYEGRRWDMRVHVLATSLSPLRYRLLREGIAKTTAEPMVPGSTRPEEWLNADSLLKNIVPAENMPLSKMLEYTEAHYWRLNDFWCELNDVVRQTFECIAAVAEDEGFDLGRAFMFAGLDLIVEKLKDSYAIRLLEVNQYPGLGWSPAVSSALLGSYRDLFDDLRVLVARTRVLDG